MNEEARISRPTTLSPQVPVQPGDLAPRGRRPLNRLVHQDEVARQLAEELVRYNPVLAHLLAELA